MRWMNELSGDARSLLEKERELAREPEDRRNRVLARARAAVRASSEAPRSSALWLRPGRLLAAALTLALATVSYAAWKRTRSAEPVPPEVAAPAPTTADVAEPAPVTPTPEVAPAEPEPAKETPPAPARKLDSAAAASPSAASYALELAALEPARAAVAKGEHAAALRAVANHERRFPTGILREEREALRIKALAGLGRSEQARRAAEQFRERFPRSVLSPSLEEAVKKTP